MDISKYENTLAVHYETENQRKLCEIFRRMLPDKEFCKVGEELLEAFGKYQEKRSKLPRQVYKRARFM